MFIRSLHLRGLLSFRDAEIELGPLNVLIGPNGSGKSNLIETIGLLRACALELNGYIAQGGGPQAWIWKGDREFRSFELTAGLSLGGQALVYSGEYGGSQTVAITRESLGFDDSPGQNVFDRTGEEFRFGPATVVPGQRTSNPIQAIHSILSQHKLASDPTPITSLANALKAVRIYRNFETGKNDLLRQGSTWSGEDTHLDERGQNLALVLHDFFVGDRLAQISNHLLEFSAELKAAKPRFLQGRWMLQLDHEGLLDPIPGPRISDGTLKLLCLLAVLHDPNPPPLVCIEEPEVGLHPDAVRLVGKALIEASKLTQLVVTTHSPHLIDSLTATPEAVLVFEKDFDHSTRISRLDRENLQEWLSRYSLGELWMKGEIGGNRW